MRTDSSVRTNTPIGQDLSNNISRSESLQNIESAIVRNITESLTSILRNYSNDDVDTSHNLIYEFEFPINFNSNVVVDPSENWLEVDPVD